MTALKAAAYDAQQQALAAQAESERVQRELAAAQEAATVAPSVVAPAPIPVAMPVAAAPPTPIVINVASPPPAPTPAPVVAASPSYSPAEIDALEEAVRDAQADANAAQADAEAAHAAADAARAEIEAFKQKHALRFARKGLVIGANLFYAPEIFDTDLSVENGSGFGMSLGYRVHKNFEVGLQADRVTGFDLSGFGITGEITGWTATANLRVFLMTGSFQPFFGFGLGAFYAEADARDIDGNREKHEQAAGLFKLNGGFDYYISERLAVTADAAIFMPGGELSGLTFATLGGGVKLRF